MNVQQALDYITANIISEQILTHSQVNVAFLMLLLSGKFTEGSSKYQ